MKVSVRTSAAQRSEPTARHGAMIAKMVSEIAFAAAVIIKRD
jgi:hypothetical protein